MSNNITIGLIGNPNCGKTTIFNELTGSHHKVANWSGVTVEKIENSIEYKNFTIKIIDLPGIYSLSSFSMEELVTRKFILEDKPDIIINVVDSGNLERNLYLTTQLLEMNCSCIIALNMYDEAEKKGLKFNLNKMSELLGMPIVPTIGSRGMGIIELLNQSILLKEKDFPKPDKKFSNYSKELLKAIYLLSSSVTLKSDIYPSDWIALRLLENDRDLISRYKANSPTIIDQADAIRKKITELYNDDIETIISDCRYGFIKGFLKETISQQRLSRFDLTEKIDKFFLNKILSYPILLLVVWLLFFLTFTLGSYPMELIDKGVQGLSHLIAQYMPDGSFKDLLINGVIAGVGGVIVFLPNIVFLFLGISFLEDTGYMARAAFIMDKIMHRFGLHGKSFIPMIMGFGCNVPAIIGTRMLENKKDRILTILINPFMSCSARLPVYILFAAAFFPKHASLIIMILYGLGILAAFGSAKLFNLLIFKKESSPFVMELPPYRMPTLKTIFYHMWDRASEYLKKMGGIILIFSIIIWTLGEYPKSESIEKEYMKSIQENTILLETAKSNNNNILADQYKLEIEKAESDYHHNKIEHSTIGKIGKIIHPTLKPLGFNEEMSISVVTGIVAKEIVVGTLSILYHQQPHDNNNGNLSLTQKLSPENSGISKLTGFVFMLFVMLYIPCFASFIAIGREIGWRWATFSLIYQIMLAWLTCFIVFQGLSLIL